MRRASKNVKNCVTAVNNAYGRLLRQAAWG